MTLDLDYIRKRANRYEDSIERESSTWFAAAASSANDVPALIAEVERLRAVLDEIRHLHTDSPAGVCPSCADLNAELGGDPLVDYPCPTLRAMGIKAVDRR